MKLTRHWAALLALVLFSCAPSPVMAQVTLPQVLNAGGAHVPAQAAVLADSTGAEKGTSGNPVSVLVTTGPATQAVTSTDGALSTIGAKADGAYGGTGAASLIAINKGIYSALVAPLPAGSNTIGAISNTSFGISGTLPAFAATPTVQPAYAAPAAYTTGTWFDARAYATVMFSATAAGSVAYAPKWSPDNGITVAAMTCIDLNFNTTTAFGTSAATAISCKGSGYVELTGGTGGTFLISAGQ